MSEIDTISEVVTEVYMDWLRAEVESSHVERNKILDDYDDAIEGLKGGWITLKISQPERSKVI